MPLQSSAISFCVQSLLSFSSCYGQKFIQKLNKLPRKFTIAADNRCSLSSQYITLNISEMVSIIQSSCERIWVILRYFSYGCKSQLSYHMNNIPYSLPFKSGHQDSFSIKKCPISHVISPQCQLMTICVPTQTHLLKTVYWSCLITQFSVIFLYNMNAQKCRLASLQPCYLCFWHKKVAKLLPFLLFGEYIPYLYSIPRNSESLFELFPGFLPTMTEAGMWKTAEKNSWKTAETCLLENNRNILGCWKTAETQLVENGRNFCRFPTKSPQNY